MFDSNMRHSISELFKLHRRELLTYLTRRAGPDNASDLLQETFVRALRRRGPAAIADPHAFLQVIAVNLARDFARRRKTEAKYLEFGDLPEVPSTEAAPGEYIEGSEKSQLLRAAVESLPPRCREVFVLVMHENVPLKKAAKRLGISDSMARRHLRLAFQRCRAAVS
jgi:RNA polymerase sigma factor (sigma-70 family)